MNLQFLVDGFLVLIVPQKDTIYYFMGIKLQGHG